MTPSNCLTSLLRCHQLVDNIPGFLIFISNANQSRDLWQRLTNSHRIHCSLIMYYSCQARHFWENVWFKAEMLRVASMNHVWRDRRNMKNISKLNVNIWRSMIYVMRLWLFMSLCHGKYLQQIIFCDSRCEVWRIIAITIFKKIFSKYADNKHQPKLNLFNQHHSHLFKWQEETSFYFWIIENKMNHNMFCSL